MADVTTKTFTQLIQGFAAAVQARASGLVDFTVGSIERATGEAVSGVVLWLQGLILKLLAATRAQTSTGADLDSWIADFAGAPTSADVDLITRFPARPASGSVTFSRLTTTGQAVIPVDPTGASPTTVSTQDGSQIYAVGIDTTNVAYSAALGGYVLAIGTASVSVPVTAQTPGAASNAVTGAINTITSAIPGVDAVTNGSAFTNGTDPETDAAYLIRFRRFLRSLREATPAALAFVISSLQQGVQCFAVEGVNYDGTAHAGYFYFVVDDGSGAAPTSLINAAGAVIDAHRAAGVAFGAFAAVKQTIDATMTATIATGADAVAAKLAARTAVTAYLNALPLGTLSVPLSRIYQVAHDASPDILEITGLTLNSVAADVTLTVKQVGKAGTVTVN